jgi:hypothetical protein
MKTTQNTTIPDLDLTLPDLYVQLAEERANEAAEALRLVPTGPALRWATDCLAETVAHLRHSARYLDRGDGRRAWIDSVTCDLIFIAAQFEHDADLLTGPARRNRD